MPIGAIVITLALLVSARFSTIRRALALTFCLCLIAGNFYYAFDDYHYARLRQGEVESGQFTARITDDPETVILPGGEIQRVKLNISSRGHDKKQTFLADLPPDPPLIYGDNIEFTGSLEPTPVGESYGDYLAKERIHGLARSSTVTVVGNNANPLWASLYQVKAVVRKNANHFLNHSEAAFLIGITLGEHGQFSREFLSRLSESGTRHLIALSGLHISIIIFSALALLTPLCGGRRTTAKVLTLVLVILFVGMTGFKISAIRASLMAFLAMLARQTGRERNPANVIALAALVITITNPKAPVFDLGFQLSFLATLGIVYFVPIIERFKFFKTIGLLGWRSILAVTVSAQLAVAPLTIINFGNFSLTSLPANVTILVGMPILMTSGLILGLGGSFLGPIAGLLSLPVAFLIDYSIAIVNIASSFKINFNPTFGRVGLILYYVGLTWLAIKFSPLKHDDKLTGKTVLRSEETATEADGTSLLNRL